MVSKRTFDLDDYFVDPEGDPITYTAHTNIYTNVVAIGEGNVLTVTGANADRRCRKYGYRHDYGF